MIKSLSIESNDKSLNLASDILLRAFVLMSFIFAETSLGSAGRDRNRHGTDNYRMDHRKRLCEGAKLHCCVSWTGIAVAIRNQIIETLRPTFFLYLLAGIEVSI